MAAVEIYRAEAWHELIACKARWLGDSSAVMVVPSEAERSAAAAALPEVPGESIVTIPGLIEQYVKGSGRSGLISRQGLESILGKIISQSPTVFLHMEKYRQGYVKALTDFLYNFRVATLAELQTAVGTLGRGGSGSRVKDLMLIDEACRKKLDELGFDLRSGLEGLLHDSEAAGFDLHRRLGLPKRATLIFWGFDTLTPLEARFVALIFEKARRAVFLYCADPEASEQALRVGESITDLLAGTGAPPAVDLSSRSAPRDYFSVLARSLFQPGPAAGPAADEGSSTGERLAVHRANDRFAEVVSMARRIRALIREGASYGQIRMVAPAYDLYATIIRELFPEYGIPFILEKGIPLLDFPLAALIYNLVGCSVQANPFALREKIFSSPYVTYESTVDRAALVDYQEAAGVELIPAADLRGHPGFAGRCRLDYRAVSRLHRTAYRAVQPAAGTDPLVTLEKYLSGAGSGRAGPEERFQALLQSFLLERAEKELLCWRPQMSIPEFGETLCRLLRRFKIIENVRARPDSAICGVLPGQSLRQREERVIAQIDLVLKELGWVLAPLARSDDEPFPLMDLVRTFTRLLSGARLPGGFDGAAEGDGGGGPLPAVSVQRVDRSQYRRWDYTFICGLVDGEFPRADEFNFLQPRGEGLLPGRAHTGVELARNRFYQLIRATKRALYLSSPRSSNGRRLPPSPLLGEVEKQLTPPGAVVAPPEMELLYSRREKLLAIAGNVDCDYAGALPLLKELRREDEAIFEQALAVMRFDGLTAGAAPFCEYDGIFDPAGPAAPLLERLVGGIDFTAEILERYAACPLRFFFDDILGLKKEPDYHPDLAERGAAILTILREYTAAMCAAGKALDGEAAAGLLYELTSRYFERQAGEEAADAFQFRFRKQLTAGLEGEGGGRPGLLHAFLQYEAEGPDQLKLCRANLSGVVELGPALPVSVEIDRVDIAPKSNRYFLYRYTTMSGDPRRVRRGLRFDIPLMLMLFAGSGFGEPPAASGSGAAPGPLLRTAGAGLYMVKSPRALQRCAYFALRQFVAPRRHLTSEERPVFSGQREGIHERERFDIALESIAEHIRRLHRLMKRGVFHPPLCLEAEQSCGNCSFGRLCRKEQDRLDRLSLTLADAENVNQIRGLF